MSVAKFVITATLIAVIAVPALAKKSSTASPKQGIQAIYQKMDSAYTHKDLHAYLAFYDPSYVGYDLHQQPENLSQLAGDTQKMQKMDWDMSAKTTIGATKPYAGGLIVMSHTIMVYTTKDIYTGAILHVTVDETDEDYWIKSASTWKMRQENVLSQHVWENGHQIQ